MNSLQVTIFKQVRTHLLAQLNGFSYCYQTITILYDINPLFAHTLKSFKYCNLTLAILINVSNSN